MADGDGAPSAPGGPKPAAVAAAGDSDAKSVAAAAANTKTGDTTTGHAQPAATKAARKAAAAAAASAKSGKATAAASAAAAATPDAPPAPPFQPIQCKDVRKGMTIMIKGRPCKVLDIMYSKTGKHGTAKARFVGTDILTGTKLEELTMQSMSLEQLNPSRERYQLIDTPTHDASAGTGQLPVMDDADGSALTVHVHVPPAPVAVGAVDKWGDLMRRCGGGNGGALATCEVMVTIHRYRVKANATDTATAAALATAAAATKAAAVAASTEYCVLVDFEVTKAAESAAAAPIASSNTI